jgi:hypothetical protein
MIVIKTKFKLQTWHFGATLISNPTPGIMKFTILVNVCDLIPAHSKYTFSFNLLPIAII